MIEMPDLHDKISTPPVAGHVKITADDGRESSFSNYIMMDHYKIILRSLLGKNNSEIGVFGAGTSTSDVRAKNLSKMTSETESSKTVSYAVVADREPVDSLSELDVDIEDVPDHVQDYTAGVAFTGTFTARGASELDEKEISEIALFASDKNHPEDRGQMFARTIIPEEERLEKFPAGSLTFLWVIYYGFEEVGLKSMNGVSP